MLWSRMLVHVHNQGENVQKWKQIKSSWANDRVRLRSWSRSPTCDSVLSWRSCRFKTSFRSCWIVSSRLESCQAKQHNGIQLRLFVRLLANKEKQQWRCSGVTPQEPLRCQREEQETVLLAGTEHACIVGRKRKTMKEGQYVCCHQYMYLQVLSYYHFLLENVNAGFCS